MTIRDIVEGFFMAVGLIVVAGFIISNIFPHLKELVRIIIEERKEAFKMKVSLVVQDIVDARFFPYIRRVDDLRVKTENRDNLINLISKELNEEKIKTNTMKHDMHTIFEELGQMRQIYDRNRTTKFLYSEAVREAKKASRRKKK